jgi:hypothetical protein
MTYYEMYESTQIVIQQYDFHNKPSKTVKVIQP